MTEKKKSGGQVKHGAYCLIKRGQMPSGRGYTKVKQYVDELEESLIQELGGHERTTPQQRILLESVLKAYQIQVLIELWINKVGPIDAKKFNVKKELNLHPILGKSYLSFQNSVRLGLEKLFPNGFERKEAAFNLPEYIDKTYGKKGEEDDGKQ